MNMATPYYICYIFRYFDHTVYKLSLPCTQKIKSLENIENTSTSTDLHTPPSIFHPLTLPLTNSFTFTNMFTIILTHIIQSLCPLTRASTHLLTPSQIYLPTYSSPNHSLVFTLTHSSPHLVSFIPTPLFTNSSIYPFTHLVTLSHSLIIYSFTNTLAQSLTHLISSLRTTHPNPSL